MEVAITGQFSSGKSTFLNALLSRNILPTGITPVTSKVNFINYGDEYKLKITYYSGAQEFAPIESIADFTDQREDEMQDIKYLTLYAPMDILKRYIICRYARIEFSKSKRYRHYKKSVKRCRWYYLANSNR